MFSDSTHLPVELRRTSVGDEVDLSYFVMTNLEQLPKWACSLFFLPRDAMQSAVLLRYGVKLKCTKFDFNFRGLFWGSAPNLAVFNGLLLRGERGKGRESGREMGGEDKGREKGKEGVWVEASRHFFFH